MEVIKQSKNGNDISGKISMKTLNERKLNVAAYARVSTEHEDQHSSFDSQQIYYSNKISKNQNWSFVGVYADEGISGTRTKRRENFIKMIKDAINGKIDLIMTKSVSRFARNTLDTLNYVRILKDKGVAVYFEEENINTLDMNGELLLSILGSIAQQESENLSAHVLLGLKMKSQQGKIIGSTSCYGYDYDKEQKQFFVNPKTSKIIKKIFQLYLEGNGTYKIAKILTKEKLPTAKGNTTWNEGTITHILKNERYKGDLLNGKYYSSDPITKKPKKNKGERDQYYIKNHHEPIIDRDTWDKVQKVMKERANRVGNKRDEDFNVRYPFSGIFICGFCQKSLIRNNCKTMRNPKYYCESSYRNINKVCTESKMIDEEIIKKVFMEMVIKLRRKIKLDDKFPKKVKDKISPTRKILLNREDLNEKKYEQQLVNQIIKYGIVGEVSDSGKAKPYVIRFILKTAEDLIFTDYKRESINLYKLLEFNSFNILYYFEKDRNGKPKQIFVDKIKVTCEVDLGED